MEVKMTGTATLTRRDDKVRSLADTVFLYVDKNYEGVGWSCYPNEGNGIIISERPLSIRVPVGVIVTVQDADSSETWTFDRDTPDLSDTLTDDDKTQWVITPEYL